ncbi:MAG: hypothetical protein AAF152_20160, partial [Cyanobacteria bacterium P01_A01_bin.114]
RFRLVEPTQQTRFSPQQNFPPLANWPLTSPTLNRARSHVSGRQEDDWSQETPDELTSTWEGKYAADKADQNSAETTPALNRSLDSSQSEWDESGWDESDWGETEGFIESDAADSIAETSMETTVDHVDHIDTPPEAVAEHDAQPQVADPYETLAGPAGDSMSEPAADTPLPKVTKSEAAIDSGWSSSTVESLEQAAPL